MSAGEAGRILVVYYHYIRDDSPYHSMRGAEFEAQVRRLMQAYAMVSLPEALTWSCPEPACVLTFDDGLRDGYATAFPILKDLRLPAAFFIPTAVWDSLPRLLNAQKRHILLARWGVQEFVRRVNARVPPPYRVEPYMGHGDRDDDPLTYNLKWMLDHMPIRMATDLLDGLLGPDFDEKEASRELYIQPDEAVELAQAGMTVGLHGHTHERLGPMGYDGALGDLRKAVEAFRHVFPNDPLYLSYPFGSYTLLTLRAAETLGFACGLTTQETRNTPSTPRLEWGRVDCIRA